MVGTVLQDPERQILGTRVLHEVAFGLENLGLPRAEIYQRVDEALELPEDHPHLQMRETFNLSGGEKQKVALAGVLAMRPILCWTNRWPAWTRPAPRRPWTWCAGWRTKA